VSDKPSYLGLLNAISLAETDAHCYLMKWAEVTPSDEVRAVLTTVAYREGEHGLTFAKRINELGYNLVPKENPKFEEQMAIVSADCSDLEKFEALGVGRLDEGDGPDVFAGFFNDKTIDIQTGELLGRYISEERDSGRLLRHCHSLLKEAAGPTTGASSSSLAGLEDKVESLCRAVEDLRQVVCAQTMEPAGASSSKRK